MIALTSKIKGSRPARSARRPRPAATQTRRGCRPSLPLSLRRAAPIFAEPAAGSADHWRQPRAAMSQARLWRDQDKRADAREALAPAYGWFTEGFHNQN